MLEATNSELDRAREFPIMDLDSFSENTVCQHIYDYRVKREY